MLFFVTAFRNVIFKHQVHAQVKLVQTQQHVDRRAAKRTAASFVVHFVGTRLTEALMTARHQRDACITRCLETHHFLAHPMARPRVTLMTSDTLSMVICCRCPMNLQTNQCSVAMLTGRFACELRLATSTHESHDSHTLEYFLLMAFDTLSLLHFPLPHFQRHQRRISNECTCCHVAHMHL